MTLTLIRNGRIVDGLSDRPGDRCDVLVEGDRIREVSTRGISAPGARIVDAGGRVLMPGLIDCHVHVIATMVNLAANAMLPNALVAHRSARIMREMLMRGFTTVRDLGGADYGQVLALEEGLIEGPRLVICGKALSQTGGHGDQRGRYDARPADHYAQRLGSLGRVCDGVDAVRRAAREEIKAGATFIKLMVNGGVSSPTDPIAFFGFARDEIRAAVEEAESAQTYVAGHLYTDEAIRRAVECGVWSVEHGNLVTRATADMMREKGAIVVPTLVTFDALAKEGASLGLPADSVAKIEDVRGAGLASLEIYKAAGVTMGYGTDLLGDMHRHQSEEFVIRGQVLPAQDVIRSATHDAAKVMRMEGKIGVIADGAFADLIVVDGNPLEDLTLLTHQGRHMPMILARGRVVKNELQSSTH